MPVELHRRAFFVFGQQDVAEKIILRDLKNKCRFGASKVAVRDPLLPEGEGQPRSSDAKAGRRHLSDRKVKDLFSEACESDIGGSLYQGIPDSAIRLYVYKS